MANWSLASYNRFLGEMISKFDLSRKDAAQAYREMRGNLERPVFRSDIKSHSVIAKRSAERAFAKKEQPPAEFIGASGPSVAGIEPSIPPEEELFDEEDLDEGEDIEGSEIYEE